MKSDLKPLILTLTLLASASSFAGHEGYGLPAPMTPVATCTPFESNGHILLGEHSPEIDSLGEVFYLKQEVLYPTAEPRYNPLTLIQQFTMADGIMVKVYQASSLVIRLTFRGNTLLSGSIQAGQAIATCVPSPASVR
jgi:hypothetical protein